LLHIAFIIAAKVEGRGVLGRCVVVVVDVEVVGAGVVVVVVVDVEVVGAGVVVVVVGTHINAVAQLLAEYFDSMATRIADAFHELGTQPQKLLPVSAMRSSFGMYPHEAGRLPTRWQRCS
jgi:glycine/D-amino acid oxidase-like deaminating enzyme